jgi:nitroreductase
MMKSNILKETLSVINGVESNLQVNKLKREPISNEDIDKLIHVAMLAPAVGRMLPWKFIIVKDKAKLNVLSGALPLSDTIQNAGTGIAVCVFPEEAAMSSEADAIQDCFGATENILLAAKFAGVAADWVDIYPDKELMTLARKELGIPQPIIPVNFIALAYTVGREAEKTKLDVKNFFSKYAGAIIKN